MPNGYIPGSVDLFDAEYGINQTLYVDQVPQWDGSFNAYDSWTGESFSYYEGDPFLGGDEYLYDWSEGVNHFGMFDSWSGTTTFTDYNTDYYSDPFAPTGNVPLSVNLFDAEYGINQTLYIDQVPQLDGSFNAYDSVTFESFSYYEGDPFVSGDEYLYDWSEGVNHFGTFDPWYGTTTFTDYNTDYYIDPFAPTSNAPPASVTLYDAEYGIDKNIMIDPILQWDGSYNAYDSWTGEGFSYYPGDPNYAGDDFLVDWSEGAYHLVQVDMWGSPMLDWAGDPMFADYTPDFLF